jgi:ABC-type Fe3+-siderophore transport system permease subunit
MPAVVGVVAVVAVLVALAATLATYPAVWRSFRYEWRRIPPERKPRAIAGGAVAVALVAVVAVLVIVAPWGHANPAYVILIGIGGLMLLVLVVAGLQAVQDTRRAKRRHRATSGSVHEE